MCVSAFRAYEMEQPSNPTKARSFGEQIDVYHEVQLDSGLHPDADSRATGSPEAHLLDFAEVLVQLCQV